MLNYSKSIRLDAYFLSMVHCRTNSSLHAIGQPSCSYGSIYSNKWFELPCWLSGLRKQRDKDRPKMSKKKKKKIKINLFSIY